MIAGEECDPDQEENYVSVCKEVVFRMFVLKKVQISRENADKGARQAWRNLLFHKKTRDRIGFELNRGQILKRESYKNRDLVNKNFLLFLEHSFGVQDLKYDMR